MRVILEIWLREDGWHITRGGVSGLRIGEYKEELGVLIDVYDKEIEPNFMQNYIEQSIEICKGNIKADKYIVESSFKVVKKRFKELDSLVEECKQKHIDLNKLCSGLIEEHETLCELIKKAP